MNIMIGSDHGGYLLKEDVSEYLRGKGYTVHDVGTYSEESCDYPEIAAEGCERILSGKDELGILICGTGAGISIAANKIKDIRAACCSDVFTAEYIRRHNDANILCFGGRVVTPETAFKLVDAFLGAKFEGGRHERRVNEIKALEECFGHTYDE